jgi:hypothetical protein
MNPVSSLQAAILAVVGEIGVVAVSYGWISNTQLAPIVSAIGGLVAIAFIIANSVHAHAAATVTAASIANPQPAATPAKAGK